MNKNKIALSSMSMDLKRVALGFQRNSNDMAWRFLQEALARKNEVDVTTIKPYLKIVLQNIEKMNTLKDTKKLTEDALMYSTLLQNACLV